MFYSVCPAGNEERVSAASDLDIILIFMIYIQFTDKIQAKLAR